MITREDIIGKKRPVPVKKIDTPGWGEVYVRKLSAAERVLGDYIRMENDGKPANWHARLAVLWASDEYGNRIFTDADATALGDDPAHADAIAAICAAGFEFNAMRDADHEEAKKN